MNVFIRAHSTFATIAHSYFIQTDRDGMVVESAPRLIKQYKAAVVTEE